MGVIGLCSLQVRVVILVLSMVGWTVFAMGMVDVIGDLTRYHIQSTAQCVCYTDQLWIKLHACVYVCPSQRQKWHLVRWERWKRHGQLCSWFSLSNVSLSGLRIHHVHLTRSTHTHQCHQLSTYTALYCILQVYSVHHWHWATPLA